MEDLGYAQLKTHVIIFFVLVAMYVLNFIPTEKFITAMLTYNAVMTGAIYFKINSNGKRKDTGADDSHAASSH